MPLHLVRRVQCAALHFISPVPWVQLGFLCHVSAVYGLRVQLRDLRLANVASIISSFGARNEIHASVASALGNLHARMAGGRRPLLRSDSLHPADHCLRAHVFFTSAVGAPPDALTPHGQNMGSPTCSFRDAY